MKEQDAGWNLDKTYLKLPKKFFSKIDLNNIAQPEIIVLNNDLGSSLGLHMHILNSEQGAKILSGSELPPGGALIAQAYAGHQFGNFTMLGDGRAVLIGEQITPEGKRFDIQLKGSGRTPYSRGGDGLAPLGPMLREYIMSEAMHSLGIPTTRSLAVVTTGEEVFRTQVLEGAILTRVAKSHIRVGTFQYAANFGDREDIKALADYTINRHFPELKARKNPYLGLLEEVIKSQADLIAKWQRVGFIHGVMNTDNMAIGGETIDYGPCAFMDTYDATTVFSSIDRHARYAYGKQPSIGGWNITRFAETLLPFIHEETEESIKIAQEVLKTYEIQYHSNWLDGMRRKLGILNEEKEDESLIKELLTIMSDFKADFTNTFVGLTEEAYRSLDQSGLFKSDEFKGWDNKWKARLERQEDDLNHVKEIMKRQNHIIIPRNHQVEKALEAATSNGDYTMFNNLLKALSSPYDYHNIEKEYMMPADPLEEPYRTFCGT